MLKIAAPATILKIKVAVSRAMTYEEQAYAKRQVSKIRTK